MKRKLGSFITEHKIFSIILGIALLVFIMLLIVIIMLFLGNSSNAYGDRLEGIEEVKLKDNYLEKIEKKLMDNDSVQETNIRVQGKIVYVDIFFSAGTSIDTAKQIGNSVLEEFSEDELAFYDIEVLLSEIKEGEESPTGFNAIGTKHPSKEEITWNKG